MPYKGLFNLSSYNDGGRSTLANRIYNHRTMVQDIHPKPLDYKKFMAQIRPQDSHQQKIPESNTKVSSRPSMTLLFRRLQPNKQEEIQRHQLLYKNSLNIPRHKKYQEKDMGQMLQNYCDNADPYGHKETHIRLQQKNGKYTDLRSNPIRVQKIYQRIDLLIDDDNIEPQLIDILSKVRQNEEQARVLNYIQQLYPRFEDDQLMAILYQSMEIQDDQKYFI